MPAIYCLDTEKSLKEVIDNDAFLTTSTVSYLVPSQESVKSITVSDVAILQF